MRTRYARSRSSRSGGGLDGAGRKSPQHARTIGAVPHGGDLDLAVDQAAHLAEVPADQRRAQLSVGETAHGVAQHAQRRVHRGGRRSGRGRVGRPARPERERRARCRCRRGHGLPGCQGIELAGAPFDLQAGDLRRLVPEQIADLPRGQGRVLLPIARFVSLTSRR